MAERDRAKTASRQDTVREAAIADIEKATVSTLWTSERQEAHKVADRISMVRDEGSANAQMVATTSSTAARTRSRVVTDELKCSVRSFSLRSASTKTTPSISRQPEMMCS